MMERYAALINSNGDADWVIVIPADAPPADEYCARIGLAGEWRDCPSLPGIGWRHSDGAFYRHWVQVPGAGGGPEGAESGYPVGAEVWRDGAARVSRQPNNVNDPAIEPTTWSRADGRYVVPAGWQYQPGEEITEDGETWFRITQPTSHRPSESPAQFVRVSGKGGEVVAEGYPAWVQPTGAHDAYPRDAMVTHAGQNWRNTGSNANVWEPGVFGWVVIP